MEQIVSIYMLPSHGPGTMGPSVL